MTDIKDKFARTRAFTETICAPLKNEDYSVQPIIDVSPPKWHLAHSTWFFEQFILQAHKPNYKVYDQDFAYLFNSYYNTVGKRVLRPNRGLMTRPVVAEVYAYRKYVTEAILTFLDNDFPAALIPVLELGINHEEQHQELLNYDIKYILGKQPFFPAFESKARLSAEDFSSGNIEISEGIYEIGHQSNEFCFDNELNVHKVYLNAYTISNKLVTNAEYIEFINDGGYTNFNFWHAEGWDFIQSNEIQAPLYWHQVDGIWHYYDNTGLVPVNGDLPLMHVNFYEAYAYAEWKGMRLPTEFEWEVASKQFKWGQLWEWTNSAYLPYPGFSKKEGALGEYNGKFMVSQHVLRGASIATATGHSRHTYRNFFSPQLRWMFSGIRLAQ